MKHLLLTVGKPKFKFVAGGLDEYLKRLKPYGGCTLDWVRQEKPRKGIDPAALMGSEAVNLAKRLDARDLVWALDRKGEAWDSVQWSKEVDHARTISPHRLVLIIGGPHGLGSKIKERAKKLVSLGPPTLAHELAALVVMEQLYRAYTIIVNTPYHK